MLGQALDGATPEKLKAVSEAFQHDEAIALVEVFRRSSLHSERIDTDADLQAPEAHRDERPRLVS